MHRQTFIFLLSHKITTVQQKTKHNKHEKLSHQSIVKSITKTTTTNNPHNLSIKNALKTNTTYNRIIHQDFLNIIISQMATASEPTTNTLFIKTQRNRTKKNHGQQHYEIMYYKHEKETFHIFG